MDEIRMYTKEELAQMPFGEVVDYINELWDGFVAKLNSPIGYLDLDSLDKQNEIERLKNLLKGKAYTIEQQLKVIDCYRKKEIRELKEKLNKGKQDTSGYAPVNFVLEDSNSSYSEYAIHLMRKYEALTDSGFSHDDAMSLIPLWDDADFEEFKKGI